jgi:hypothetical protein
MPADSGCPPQHSYGVRAVNRAGVGRPLLAGSGSAGGAHRLSSTFVSRLICAGWYRMTGCAMVRSGAVLWRRAWPVWAALSVLSGRSSRRCAGALSSPSRCWWRLLHRRECPAVSGEFAGDGDHDDRAGLASNRCLRSQASCARVHAVASYNRPMAEEQLREPVPSAHQIAASVLAGADQITRGLLLRPGHRTGVVSPSRSSLASRSASRRVVVTLSAAARIFDGAATTQLIPAPAHARASRYPVGPASYTSRTGAGNVVSHSTVASHPGGSRSDRTSPLPRSITPATTDRACTSSPTQLPSFITGASRNCGSTAGPIPTATRADLRARRRALHTVWRSRRATASTAQRESAPAR